MQHHVVVTGTFAGHVLPGSLFVLWALLWLAEAARLPAPEGDAALERSSLLPTLKVVLPLVGVWLEMPNRGWFPEDAMMAWQHIAMYLAFVLSGIVDLLVARGRLSFRAGYAAYAAALLNAGLLFWGHGRHGGVPGVAHSLLSIAFFAAAFFPLVELVRPSWGASWFRFGSLLALGSWFLVIAWILYRSGWDMADPVREGWTYLLFSGTAMAAGVVTLAVRLGSGARTAGGWRVAEGSAA